MSRGYTGISFPFRIGNRGGIVMSSTSSQEVPHIIESMQQILGTGKRERVNNDEFGSDIDTQIFEQGDITSHNLIRFQIVEALERHEPRILVTEDDIDITQEGSKLIAEINFIVLSYQTAYTARIDLGGASFEGEKYRL